MTLRLFIRSLRFWFQRRTRGWDDSETWGLDTTIARFVAPRLKRFREIANGYPGELTEKKWDEMLAKMQLAFELIAADQIEDEDRPEIEEGLRLFAEWFRGLWW